eukprot:c29903_g1_i1 orf=71-328(+)
MVVMDAIRTVVRSIVQCGDCSRRVLYLSLFFFFGVTKAILRRTVSHRPPNGLALWAVQIKEKVQNQIIKVADVMHEEATTLVPHS